MRNLIDVQNVSVKSMSNKQRMSTGFLSIICVCIALGGYSCID